MKLRNICLLFVLLLFAFSSSVKSPSYYLAPQTTLIHASDFRVLNLLGNLYGLFKEVEGSPDLMPPMHMNAWDNIEKILDQLSQTEQVGSFFKGLDFFHKKLPSFFRQYKERIEVQGVLELIGWISFKEESFDLFEKTKLKINRPTSETYFLVTQTEENNFYYKLKLGYLGSLYSIGKKLFSEENARRYELFLIFMSKKRYYYLMEGCKWEPSRFLIYGFLTYLQIKDEQKEIYLDVSQHLTSFNNGALSSGIMMELVRRLHQNKLYKSWLNLMIYVVLEVYGPEKGFLLLESTRTKLELMSKKLEEYFQNASIPDDFDHLKLEVFTGMQNFDLAEKILRDHLDRISQGHFDKMFYASPLRALNSAPVETSL